MRHSLFAALAATATLVATAGSANAHPVAAATAEDFDLRHLGASTLHDHDHARGHRHLHHRHSRGIEHGHDRFRPVSAWDGLAEWLAHPVAPPWLGAAASKVDGFSPVARRPVATAVVANASVTTSAGISGFRIAQAQPKQIGRYIVTSQLPAERTLALVEHLEVVNSIVEASFAGVRPVRNAPYELLLFEDARRYNEFLDANLGIDARGSAGMFIQIPQPPRFVLASFAPESAIVDREITDRDRAFGDVLLRSILRHEGFHQIAAQVWPSLPTWLNEGMAVVFEAATLTRDGQLVLGDVPFDRLKAARENLADRNRRPVGNFIRMSNRAWRDSVEAGQALANYGRSWAICHFFIYGEASAHRGAFMRMLGQMRDRENGLRALYDTDWVTWGGRIDAWMSNLKPTNYGAVLDRLEFLTEGYEEVARRRGWAEYWESKKTREGRAKRLKAPTRPLPQTIDELREALELIDFSFSPAPGVPALTLDDLDTLPSVPESSSKAMTFSLVKPEPRGGSWLTGIKPNEQPWVIRVDGVDPRAFRRDWTVTREGELRTTLVAELAGEAQGDRRSRRGRRR